MHRQYLIFYGLGVIVLSGAAASLISPPVALTIGILYGLTLALPANFNAKKTTRLLLQASVVLLGFGMNLHEVIHAGRSGFIYTAVGITASLALGLALGRMMRVSGVPSFLISTGTAICGGSAIAAVGPITHASEEEMAVSLGTVFILNSIALLIFPAVGAALNLSQNQFGLWAALAIHDTSSVVGAAAKYGAGALAVGTTVKLARALWIVPLSLVTAMVMKSKAKVQWPWFILFFCLAAVANTCLPVMAPAYIQLNRGGKIGLTVTLYLIGAGLSVPTLKKVGIRPLLQGIILWAIVAATSLALIRGGWITI